MDKLWNIYTKEHHTAIKKNKLLQQYEWISDIMLSKNNPVTKDTLWFYLYEIQDDTNLIDGNRGQNNGYF